MSLKQEIQSTHNRLDKIKQKLDGAKTRGESDLVSRFTDDVDKLEKKLTELKNKEKYSLNKEKRSLSDMPYSREITKAEQADLGKLKKKRVTVIHPMTKIGKELRLDAMTGFSNKPF
ncbi:YibL family ribosome-associated protein [Vibrio sp.]|nr:YibL family ribosome-associated protein [Vibrio sp.]